MKQSQLTFWLCLTALLIPAVSFVASGIKPNGIKVSRVYAVLVGIDKLKALPTYNVGGANDAAALKQMLTHGHCGAFIDSTQIITLTNEQATGQTIRKALQQVCAKAQEDDLVMFAYSGTGLKSGKLLLSDYDGPLGDELPGTRGFHARADSFGVSVSQKPQSVTGELAFADEYAALKQSKANRTLLLVDACYGGAWIDPTVFTANNPSRPETV